MTNDLTNLSAKDLRHAADLLEKIDSARSEFEAILSGKPAKGKPGRKPKGEMPVPEPEVAKKKARRKMSAAGRARIVAAQKKRWAAKRKADKAAG